MRIRRPPIHEVSSFDLTPMIDVMMLLLCFFMVSTTFSRGSPTPMELPDEPGSADASDSSRLEMYIEVLGQGRYRTAGKPATLQEVAAMAKQESEATGDRLAIVVRAPRDLPAGEVNALARALSAVGVKKWVLATSGVDREAGGTP